MRETTWLRAARVRRRRPRLAAVCASAVFLNTKIRDVMFVKVRHDAVQPCRKLFETLGRYKHVRIFYAKASEVPWFS